MAGKPDIEAMLAALLAKDLATRGDVQDCTSTVQLLRADLQAHVVDDAKQLSGLGVRVGRLESDVERAEDRAEITGAHHLVDARQQLVDVHVAWRYKVAIAVSLLVGLAGVLSRWLWLKG